MRQLIAGNWKMNGRTDSLAEFSIIADELKGEIEGGPADLLVCPPATLLIPAIERAKGSGLFIGAQNCSALPDGPYTGEVSAGMLMDLGATHVIVGHSERRAFQGETDADVSAKAQAAIAAGLMPIVCVGETAEQHASGRALDVIARQVERSLKGLNAKSVFAVAYEPIWAIGAGEPAGPGQIRSAHAHIRERLVQLFAAAGSSKPILYGGSVNADNAGGILSIEDVNGALIGGASLKAESLLSIYSQAVR